MKLKTLSSAIALALGIAVAGQASAQLSIPTDDVDNTGGSELLFSLYNIDTGDSYALDLGIGFNAGKSIANGTSFDLTSDALFNGVFAADSSFLQWGVVAADAVFTGSVALDPPESVWGKRMLTTSTQTVEGNAHPTNGRLSNATGATATFFQNVAVAGSHPTTANGSSLLNGGFGSWGGSNMNSLGNSVIFDTDGNIGQSLEFTHFWQDLDFVPSPIPGFIPDDVTGLNSKDAFSELLGSWLLADNGTLTYTSAVSQVPLPAGVWLFGSALAGLVGVSRRRNNVAVAAA